MLSEADLIAKRAALRWLAKLHLEWTHQDLAAALDMSRPWVSKWRKLLRRADPDDVMALHSRSYARHTPPFSIASQPAVVQRILQIRVEPPENLQRVPGPEAILYFVHRDPMLKAAGVRLPRSQTTSLQDSAPVRLHRAGSSPQAQTIGASQARGGSPVRLERWKPCPRRSAISKRQHVVEVANFVDAGTSIWLHRQVRGDFDAEALFEVVVQFLLQHGLPSMLTFDNDPRLVGSPQGRDFPSALVRFLWCVGVTPHVIPPHRPDLNAYVERFHRSFGQECLQVHRPGTFAEVSEVTEAFLTHYNSQRPSPRALVWQPPATDGLPGISNVAWSAPDGRS